ncbi:MAG TPA: xanthine dehydrogenase family protein molybdopterin-binding subunit [Candidatus Binatia bacterium]
MSDQRKTLVGASVGRVEDHRLLTGRGRFVGDIKIPGALHAAFLRSPYAHARIKKIDAGAALALPGVLLVRTGEELKSRCQPLVVEAAHSPGARPVSSYPLAVGKVRMVGDPVAIVVAADRYVAEDAAELIEVEYESLPVETDPERASRGEGERLDEELESNVAVRFSYQHGDPDAVIAGAAVAVKQTFRLQRQCPAPMEGRAIVADWNAKEKQLVVSLSTQWPQPARSMIADIVGVPEENVQVLTKDVGGAFGQKKISREDFAVVLCALELGRPVKWVEDRVESLLAASQGREETVEIEGAFSPEGDLLALKAHIINNLGAYALFPYPLDVWAAAAQRSLPGPYKFEHMGLRFTGVFTNKGIHGPYRGIIHVATGFARERLLDMAAARLGIDPLEIRRRNIIKKEDQPYASPRGQTLVALSAYESLQEAAARAGYDQFRVRQAQARKEGRLAGIGICCYTEDGPQFVIQRRNAAGATRKIGGQEIVRVRVEPDGKIKAFVAVMSHGQSLLTTLAQILADELGVDLDRVEIVQGDTRLVPDGTGTSASRSTVVGGGALIVAAQALKEKILQAAGRMTRHEGDRLKYENGAVSSEIFPDVHLTLTEIAAAAGGLEAEGTYAPPSVTTSNGTHIVMVEVDGETGQVSILRHIAVEDCGRIVNPMVLEGQIRGGVAQGVGSVLLERMAYDEEGQPQSGTLMHYLLPTALDVPAVEIHHMETHSVSLGGFKPAGEGSAIATVPALANAIADALGGVGAGINELPLTPYRLTRLMKGID